MTAEVQKSKGNSSALAPDSALHNACEAFDRQMQTLLSGSVNRKNIEDFPLSGQWHVLPVSVASVMRTRVLKLAQKTQGRSQASPVSAVMCNGECLNKDKENYTVANAEVDEGFANFLASAPLLDGVPVGATFEPCVVSFAALALAQLLYAFLSFSFYTLKSQTTLYGVSHVSLGGATDIYRQTAVDIFDLYMTYARFGKVTRVGPRKERCC